jgi:hypothetical protein
MADHSLDYKNIASDTGVSAGLSGYAFEYLHRSTGRAQAVGSLEQIVEEPVRIEASSSRDSSIWCLGAAAGAVALGAVALSGGIVLHVIGYALASLLAFTLIAMFRRRSLERAVKEGIGVPHAVNLFAVGVLLVGFAVSVAQSWLIASYLS